MAARFCEDACVLDDAARRQLRFSMFLQGFAALMLLGAAGVRIVAFGWDAVTLILLVGLGLVIAAFIWTFRRLRDG